MDNIYSIKVGDIKFVLDLEKKEEADLYVKMLKTLSQTPTGKKILGNLSKETPIIICPRDLTGKDYAGYCDYFHNIVVGKTRPFGEQICTLAHELSHEVSHQKGYYDSNVLRSMSQEGLFAHVKNDELNSRLIAAEMRSDLAKLPGNITEPIERSDSREDLFFLRCCRSRGLSKNDAKNLWAKNILSSKKEKKTGERLLSKFLFELTFFPGLDILTFLASKFIPKFKKKLSTVICQSFDARGESENWNNYYNNEVKKHLNYVNYIKGLDGNNPGDGSSCDYNPLRDMSGITLQAEELRENWVVSDFPTKSTKLWKSEEFYQIGKSGESAHLTIEEDIQGKNYFEKRYAVHRTDKDGNYHFDNFEITHEFPQRTEKRDGNALTVEWSNAQENIFIRKNGKLIQKTEIHKGKDKKVKKVVVERGDDVLVTLVTRDGKFARASYKKQAHKDQEYASKEQIVPPTILVEAPNIPNAFLTAPPNIPQPEQKNNILQIMDTRKSER